MRETLVHFRNTFSSSEFDALQNSFTQRFPPSFSSSEGEAHGPSSENYLGGTGDPPLAQDVSGPAPAEDEAGEGQDGRHPQVQDRQEAGQAGVGAEAHPGGRPGRGRSVALRQAEATQESEVGTREAILLFYKTRSTKS